MVYYFENEELKFPYYVIIFAFLNFNLFCSYFMFIPFVYPALWIYLCVYSKKHNKKIICKKNVIMLFVTLLVPFILGYIYHFAPGIYNIFNSDALEALKDAAEKSYNTLSNGLVTYGYIYINYYSNFLLFIPLTIWHIIRSIKEKKLLSFDIIFLLFLVLFIGLLVVGIQFGKVSPYYTMKNYYILWLVLIYINFKQLMNLFEEHKIITYALVIVYILAIIFNLAFRYDPLGKEDKNPNENITNVVEIFGINKTIIVDRPLDLNLKEIEILKYAKENLDFENNDVEVMGNSEQLMWTYDLLKYINYDTLFEKYTYGQTRFEVKAQTAFQKIGKVDYMIYFNASKYYNKYKDIVFENSKIIYENEAGGIIKYNK